MEDDLRTSTFTLIYLKSLLDRFIRTRGSMIMSSVNIFGGLVNLECKHRRGIL